MIYSRSIIDYKYQKRHNRFWFSNMFLHIANYRLLLNIIISFSFHTHIRTHTHTHTHTHIHTHLHTYTHTYFCYQHKHIVLEIHCFAEMSVLIIARCEEMVLRSIFSSGELTSVHYVYRQHALVQ